MVRDNEPNVNEIILRVEHTVGYLGPLAQVKVIAAAVMTAAADRW